MDETRVDLLLLVDHYPAGIRFEVNGHPLDLESIEAADAAPLELRFTRKWRHAPRATTSRSPLRWPLRPSQSNRPTSTAS